MLLLTPVLSAVAEEEMGKNNVEVILITDEELDALSSSDAAFVSEPYVPETIEKTIIGADNRVTISNPWEYPYSAIAYLVFSMECGCDGTASGFMVSANTMMTAAHCMVCAEHNKPVNSLTAYFGYRSNKNYGYKFTGGYTVWHNEGFYNGTHSSNHNWDYAYLRLNERVGDRTGWFGLSSPSDSQLDMTVVEVAGYRNGVLKTDWDYAHVYNDYQFTYENDTEPGNSGCPVFDSDYYVLGINVAGGTRDNTARRITSDLINRMRSNGLFD